MFISEKESARTGMRGISLPSADIAILFTGNYPIVIVNGGALNPNEHNTSPVVLIPLIVTRKQ